MKKRAKKTTRAGDAAGGATNEPFFRPFEKLAAEQKKKKAEEAAAKAAEAKVAAKPGAKPGAKPAAKPAPPKPPPPRAPARTDDTIAPVDPDTFAIYMSGVQPLDPRKNRIPTTASRVERAQLPKAPKEDPDAPARAKMTSLVDEGIRFETTDDGDRIEGRRVDVDPRELRRLRHGRYAVDGKLDLHGLPLDDARKAVEAFVRKRAQDGDKVVVIIHGKGSHSPRQTGVLRGEIGAWLSQGQAVRHILAFATAPDEDGGTGAVLVLLAR
jgi:DNA-nicking Smr family endonuclease